MPKKDDRHNRFRNETDADMKDLEYATRAGFWYTYKWWVAAVVAVFTIGALIWGLTVITAGPKGAGDAHKTNQSGSNRIAKQEMFEQLYADIQASDANLTVLHDAMVDDPSYVNKTNYNAGRLQCTNLVHNYDAEARKYTAKDWRDNKLPSAINQTDPKFDCKEEATK